MDTPTHDELLADAIAYAALDVLDRFADEPERRQDFLLRFLRLAVEFGAEEAMQFDTH